MQPGRCLPSRASKRPWRRSRCAPGSASARSTAGSPPVPSWSPPRWFDKVAQYAEAAEQALAIPDPWAGFVTYVERICDLQADDRGLSDLLSMALPADEDIEQLRRLANDRVAELIERAKAAGRLRQEFASEDLLLLLVAHAAVVHVTREDAPSAGRRFVALMLDAFGPQDGPSALPVPPSRAQMRRAMVRLAGERGCGERGCGEHSLGTTRPSARRG